ncbi:MAG: hypothetical protein ACXU87_23780, partial [Xanthobacteraceae bacterium]
PQAANHVFTFKSRAKDAAYISNHAVILTHRARIISDLAGRVPGSGLYPADTLQRASPSRHCL